MCLTKTYLSNIEYNSCYNICCNALHTNDSSCRSYRLDIGRVIEVKLLLRIALVQTTIKSIMLRNIWHTIKVSFVLDHGYYIKYYSFWL